jgi:hypothetical protein
MGKEEGALFLLRRATCIAEEAADEDDHSNAEKITTQLDGLPLALDQAGAYIEETGCGCRATWIYTEATQPNLGGGKDPGKKHTDLMISGKNCPRRQQIQYGTGNWTAFGNYLIAQIENRRIQTVLLAFIARNST